MFFGDGHFDWQTGYVYHYENLSLNGTLIEAYEGSHIMNKYSFLIAIKFRQCSRSELVIISSNVSPK